MLGLSKGASDEDIKKAFRQMAKKYHPDLHPDDKDAEAKFKEVNEAYEVLSDPDKKAKYDQFGHAAFDQSGFGGGGFSGFDDIDLGDIFGSIFGGAFGGGASTRRNGPRRGQDLRVGVTVSFEEAAFGCEKEVSVSRIETCDECGGNGCEKGTTPERCSACGGTGTVTRQQRTPFGVMQTQSECSACGGTGKIIHQPCKKCKGQGLVRRNTKVKVKIPAGIDDGQSISMRGKGHAGLNGGGPGDLLIGVTVIPHPFFEREGNAVLYTLPISIVQAALGCEAEVPTLDGKVKYSVPEGTQHGTTFRLRGKGIPNLRGGGRGDEYVTVQVTVPTGLSSEQKELLKKLGDSLGEANTGKTKKKRKLL